MDEKQNCIDAVISTLIMRGFSREQAGIVHGVMQLEMAQYDVKKSSNEIIPYEGDVNEELVKKFIVCKRVAGRTERTLEFYYKEVSKALRRMQKPATEVTTDDVRLLFVRREMEDKVSKVTIDNERRALSSFYTWLRDEGIINQSPLRKIEAIKAPKVKKKAFTEIELEKIRAAARTARETAIIEMLCSTGCRVTELVNIKIADIKEDSVTIIGKGEKERTVYINAKALIAVKTYLDERKDDNEYLFPKGKWLWDEEATIQSRRKDWYKYSECVADGHQDIASIQGIVRKIGKRAGVENVHPHRFRRTCATMALRRGMPLEQVSMMLGHEQISTTQIYLDLDETELKAAHKKYVI